MARHGDENILCAFDCCLQCVDHPQSVGEWRIRQVPSVATVVCHRGQERGVTCPESRVVTGAGELDR